MWLKYMEQLSFWQCAICQKWNIYVYITYITILCAQACRFYVAVVGRKCHVACLLLQPLVCRLWANYNEYAETWNVMCVPVCMDLVNILPLKQVTSCYCCGNFYNQKKKVIFWSLSFLLLPKFFYILFSFFGFLIAFGSVLWSRMRAHLP